MPWGHGCSSWGNSGWGRNHYNEDPLGQHWNSCISGNKFGKTGMFGVDYRERCPGCRYSRSMGKWGSKDPGNSSTLQLVSLFTGSKSRIAKKSLFG